MSNEEFDNLKEELMWEGSSVVMLSMSPPPFCISMDRELEMKIL